MHETETPVISDTCIWLCIAPVFPMLHSMVLFPQAPNRQGLFNIP